jgi:pyruvate formate lyase activating enzyme
MKNRGLIFDLKKYAIHDGPGIRTTVFFKGCPLDCPWCHNPEGKKAEPEEIKVNIQNNNPSTLRYRKEQFGREVSVADALEEIRKDIVFYDQSGGGATFSGGEPMMQVDFLEAILRACRNDGITTAVDTSGYADPDDFGRIYDLVDYFLYDIKMIDDTLHRKFTGVSNSLILDNFARLAGKGTKVTVRIPLIPDITDTGENLVSTADFIKSFPSIKDVSLLPYNKLGEDKREKFGLENKAGRLKTQEMEDLEKIRRLFMNGGFRVKIGG